MKPIHIFETIAVFALLSMCAYTYHIFYLVAGQFAAGS